MYSLGNKAVAVSKDGSESLNVPVEKCSHIDNGTANVEAAGTGESCDEVKGPLYYDLADVITDRSLSDIEKYGYLMKNYSFLRIKIQCLTRFKSMFHFYILWKCQKSSDFLIFTADLEMEYWLIAETLKKKMSKRWKKSVPY